MSTLGPPVPSDVLPIDRPITSSSPESGFDAHFGGYSCGQPGQFLPTQGNLDLNVSITDHDAIRSQGNLSGDELGLVYQHERSANYQPLPHALPDSNAALLSGSNLWLHQSQAHYAPAFEKKCDHCGSQCLTDIDLALHECSVSSQSRHHCTFEGCASSFARPGDLKRHFRRHSAVTELFSCPHCQRRSGQNGFKREDHLSQHLRNCHNIGLTWDVEYSCRHWSCPEYRQKAEAPYCYLWRPGELPFKSKAALTKHLKEIHDESELPCPVPSCERKGGKGYMRRSDLVRHIKAKHGNADVPS